MSLSVSITGSDPVSLASGKAHLRILHDDDDGQISNLITTALDTIERQTGRLFREATCVLKLRSFPDGPIYLPRYPLQSITSIAYIDSDGESQTLTNYLTDSGIPAAVEPAVNATWPTTQDRPDAVTVTFVAGTETTPASIKHAVMLLIDLDYHEHSTQEANRIQRRVDDLLRPFRLRENVLIGVRE